MAAKLAVSVVLLGVAFTLAPLSDLSTAWETYVLPNFAPRGSFLASHVWDDVFSPLHASIEKATSLYNHHLASSLQGGWTQAAALATLVLVLWVAQPLYSFFFEPANIVRSIEDVERDADGKKYPAFGRPRRHRGAGMPPPYPNSWFRVCNSNEVPKGEARDFEVLGTFIVVFRGEEDGKVRVLDAYCPHMGANLGVTGRVVGNDIACPFHGWQFSGEGACTHIPYATTDKVPSFVKTKAWHCVETNGSIMIWHDAEGRPPLWMVPDLKEINTGRYKSHGSTLHRVRAHIQEIPENGPDTAHLNHLHLPIGVRLLSAFGFHHGWDATWEAGTGLDEHLTFMAVKESVQFRGIYVPGSRIDVDIVQVGPGIVHLQFATPFGKVMLIQTVTPIQPLLQQVGHQVFAEWTVPRFFAKFVMRSSVAQFERDVPLWNNKVFLDQPMLIKEDGPIAKYRRWINKHFYSENSEKVARERAANTGSIDW